jgi:hypothetical protein
MIDIVLCPLPRRVWDDKDSHIKDSHIEEIIALMADYATAKSVYDGAVMQTWKVHHASAEGADTSEHAKELTCFRTCAPPSSRNLIRRPTSSLDPASDFALASVELLAIAL